MDHPKGKLIYNQSKGSTLTYKKLKYKIVLLKNKDNLNKWKEIPHLCIRNLMMFKWQSSQNSSTYPIYSLTKSQLAFLEKITRES